MYIEYDYFVGNGGSGDVTEPAFPSIEFRARKIIDRVTQNRVQSMVSVPEAVKRLMVELINIERVGGSQSVLNPSVASFSNDGYSETYAEPVTVKSITAAENKLIHEYLAGESDDNGTPLLWAGVS